MGVCHWDFKTFTLYQTTYPGLLYAVITRRTLSVTFQNCQAKQFDNPKDITGNLNIRYDGSDIPSVG